MANRTKPTKVLITAALAGFLTACAAQTQYRGIPAAELDDLQLVEELVSAVQGLGMEMDRTMYLMAIRPDPAYVLTSSTTTFSGSINARYNAYSMPVGYGNALSGRISGSVTANSSTQYRYVDARAAERLGNSIAILISQARRAAYRNRAQEVWEEYQQRVRQRREETEQLIREFFSENPDLENRRMLVAVVAPWAAAEGLSSGPAILQRSKQIIQELSRGRGLSGTWYGIFSQTTTTTEGQEVAFSEFVRIELLEKEGELAGNGLLGTGEVIELNGQLDGQRMEAAVANTTSGINVVVTGIPAESQITAEYEGYGPGQTLTGTVLLLR